MSSAGSKADAAMKQSSVDENEPNHHETAQHVSTERDSTGEASFSAAINNDDVTSSSIGEILYGGNIAAACAATNAEISLQPDLTIEEQREKKLEMNRVNAQRNRERKRLVMDILQADRDRLLESNQLLRAQNETLRQNIALIKSRMTNTSQGTGDQVFVNAADHTIPTEALHADSRGMAEATANSLGVVHGQQNYDEQAPHSQPQLLPHPQSASNIDSASGILETRINPLLRGTSRDVATSSAPANGTPASATRYRNAAGNTDGNPTTTTTTNAATNAATHSAILSNTANVASHYTGPQLDLQQTAAPEELQQQQQQHQTYNRAMLQVLMTNNHDLLFQQQQQQRQRQRQQYYHHQQQPQQPSTGLDLGSSFASYPSVPLLLHASASTQPLMGLAGQQLSNLTQQLQGQISPSDAIASSGGFESLYQLQQQQQPSTHTFSRRSSTTMGSSDGVIGVNVGTVGINPPNNWGQPIATQTPQQQQQLATDRFDSTRLAATFGHYQSSSGTPIFPSSQTAAIHPPHRSIMQPQIALTQRQTQIHAQSAIPSSQEERSLYRAEPHQLRPPNNNPLQQSEMVADHIAQPPSNATRDGIQQQALSKPDKDGDGEAMINAQGGTLPKHDK